MKVLFICKAHAHQQASVITDNQARSLTKLGIDVEYFFIDKIGIKQIFSLYKSLKRKRKNSAYDVYHAHYAFWGYLAAISGCKPLVVSLMGSDLVYKSWYKPLVKFFNKRYWSHMIVKSSAMLEYAQTEQTTVIPNGVDLEVFKPIDRETALEKTGWDSNKKHILFAANPSREEKNYPLAQQAYELIDQKQVELHALTNIDHKEMPYYYNSADVVILCSKREGSPNVIKEAMACNRPVVSTNVGDVNELMNNAHGCFITEFDPKDLAEKIHLALNIEQAESRTAISPLSADKVAHRIKSIYEAVAQ